MQHKSLLTTSIILILLSSLVVGCGSTANAQALPESQPRTLNVSGSGKSYITPDLAYISIGVHTEDKDAAKAVSANNVQSQKVSKALLAFNIAAKDIQTNNFSIYPQQQYDQSGKLQGMLYVVDNSVYVTLRDIDKIGELLNAVVEAGANSINGVQFDASDRTKALSEARKDAIENAKAIATETAELAGVKLGELQNINVMSGYSSTIMDGKGGGGGTMIAVETSVSPGQLVVTVDVNLTYIIE
jgi:uncharacterized protein YggE